MVDDEVIASLVSGQFYAEPPDVDEERERVRGLAEKYKINPDLLEQAAHDIRVCEKQDELGSWLQRTADTFGEISAERAGLMSRLKQISEMSMINP